MKNIKKLVKKDRSLSDKLDSLSTKDYFSEKGDKVTEKSLKAYDDAVNYGNSIANELLGKYSKKKLSDGTGYRRTAEKYVSDYFYGISRNAYENSKKN